MDRRPVSDVLLHALRTGTATPEQQQELALSLLPQLMRSVVLERTLRMTQQTLQSLQKSLEKPLMHTLPEPDSPPTDITHGRTQMDTVPNPPE